MNLEKLINLVLSDSNVSIEYSNINGKEKLVVNGETITESDIPELLDDSATIKRIQNHVETLEMIDDCTFNEALDIIKESYDLCTINNLLEQEHFTKDEAEAINEFIDYSEGVYRSLIAEQILHLKEVLKRF